MSEAILSWKMNIEINVLHIVFLIIIMLSMFIWKQWYFNKLWKDSYKDGLDKAREIASDTVSGANNMRDVGRR